MKQLKLTTLEIQEVFGALGCSCYGANKRFGKAINVVSIGHCYDKCCKARGQVRTDFAFKLNGVTHECFEFIDYLDDKTSPMVQGSLKCGLGKISS